MIWWMQHGKQAANKINKVAQNLFYLFCYNDTYDTASFPMESSNGKQAPNGQGTVLCELLLLSPQRLAKTVPGSLGASFLMWPTWHQMTGISLASLTKVFVTFVILRKMQYINMIICHIVIFNTDMQHVTHREAVCCTQNAPGNWICYTWKYWKWSLLHLEK